MNQKNSLIRRKRLTGVVVAAGTMAKTVKVSLQRYVKVPKVRKRIRRTHVVLVHDGSGTVRPGERVVIEETRPLSKRKHFRIIRKLP